MLCTSSPKLTIKDECRQSNSFYLLVKNIVAVSLAELNRLSIAGEDSKSTCRWNIHAKCFKNCPYFKSKVPWGTKQSICESLPKNFATKYKEPFAFRQKGLIYWGFVQIFWKISNKLFFCTVTGRSLQDYRWKLVKWVNKSLPLNEFFSTG